MLYHDPDFSRESSDVEAQMVVAQDGPDVSVKPRALCAAVQHRGSYENLHRAYEALCGWLAEHVEYRPCTAAVPPGFGLFEVCSLKETAGRECKVRNPSRADAKGPPQCGRCGVATQQQAGFGQLHHLAF